MPAPCSGVLQPRTLGNTSLYITSFEYAVRATENGPRGLSAQPHPIPVPLPRAALWPEHSVPMAAQWPRASSDRGQPHLLAGCLHTPLRMAPCSSPSGLALLFSGLLGIWPSVPCWVAYFLLPDGSLTPEGCTLAGARARPPAAPQSRGSLQVSGSHTPSVAGPSGQSAFLPSLTPHPTPGEAQHFLLAACLLQE